MTVVILSFRHLLESDMIDAIARLPFLDEETNTAHALTLARTGMFGANAPGDRPDVQNVAIVLTDGKPSNYSNTNGKLLAATAATMLRDSGVKIISVGVTNSIDVDLLKEISSPPRVEDQEYFPNPDFEKPLAMIRSIANYPCHTPVTVSQVATTTVQATTRPVQETTTPVHQTTTGPFHDTTKPISTTTHLQDTTTVPVITTPPVPTITPAIDPSKFS